MFPASPAAARTPPFADVIASAAGVVAGVIDGRTPDAAISALNDAVRPAVADLALNTLRDFGRGDFLLARLLARPLRAGDAARTRQLRALLLCALHRLEARPQAAHTIVTGTGHDIHLDRPQAFFRAVVSFLWKLERVLQTA